MFFTRILIAAPMLATWVLPALAQTLFIEITPSDPPAETGEITENLTALFQKNSSSILTIDFSDFQIPTGLAEYTRISSDQVIFSLPERSMLFDFSDGSVVVANIIDHAAAVEYLKGETSINGFVSGIIAKNFPNIPGFPVIVEVDEIESGWNEVDQEIDLNYDSKLVVSGGIGTMVLTNTGEAQRQLDQSVANSLVVLERAKLQDSVLETINDLGPAPNLGHFSTLGGPLDQKLGLFLLDQGTKPQDLDQAIRKFVYETVTVQNLREAAAIERAKKNAVTDADCGAGDEVCATAQLDAEFAKAALTPTPGLSTEPEMPISLAFDPGPESAVAAAAETAIEVAASLLPKFPVPGPPVTARDYRIALQVWAARGRWDRGRQNEKWLQDYERIYGRRPGPVE